MFEAVWLSLDHAMELFNKIQNHPPELPINHIIAYQHFTIRTETGHTS